MFKEAMALACRINGFYHQSGVSDFDKMTYFDMILENLSEKDLVKRPNLKTVPMAWHIWHITRIEDAVANIMIKERKQVFDQAWKKKMNVSITDCGNAMTANDILEFCSKINVAELLNYRKEVGYKTKEVLNSLEFLELKRKPSEKSMKRILEEGVLVDKKESIWLYDFWAKKTISGLILLPITRHQPMHLDPCFKIREMVLSKK